MSDVALKTLRQGWHGIFRASLLEIMPVGALAEHFNPVFGAPTKELYSIAGLILIKEYFDWTCEQAVNAYMFDQSVQYALNMPTEKVSLCERTLERYMAIYREDDLAIEVMETVTVRLTQLLDLDVARQRLDSTHLFSNMAQFGRTRLMGVAIKRFFTQVKRHDEAAWLEIPEAMRARYATSEQRLFGDVRGPENRAKLRQDVANDLYWLVERFADHSRFKTATTYKALARIFWEQCDVKTAKTPVDAAPSQTPPSPCADETPETGPDGDAAPDACAPPEIVPKAKTGGNVMQNPSDPEATYDGHKGPGYQVQLSETCGPDNDTQLITAALVQGAAEPDVNALGQVLDALEKTGLTPESLLADTAYGADENVLESAQRGVELVSPVPGKAPAPGNFTLSDFITDPDTGHVLQCPAGHAPESSTLDEQTGTIHTRMGPGTCAGCAHREQCPVRQRQKGGALEHTGKQQRIDARRTAQQSEKFRERYKKRGGIESTNSGLKRRCGLGRLRVRGLKAVSRAVYLKVAGWNIARAAAALRKRAREAAKGRNEGAYSGQPAHDSGRRGKKWPRQTLVAIRIALWGAIARRWPDEVQPRILERAA